MGIKPDLKHLQAALAGESQASRVDTSESIRNLGRDRSGKKHYKR